MEGSDVPASFCVIVCGGDSGARGGWTVMGGNVSSFGSESRFVGRTLVWPEELEVAPVSARGLPSSVRVINVSEVSLGLGYWNSLHGSTKCPGGAISS